MLEIWKRYGWGGRHETRPWWRRTKNHPGWSRDDTRTHNEEWTRNDGRSLTLTVGPDHPPVDEGLQQYDAEHPMEVPAAAVHQVWAAKREDGLWNEQPVVEVISGPGGPTQAMIPLVGWVTRLQWPPKRAILVSGEGAPWAPADWEGL